MLKQTLRENLKQSMLAKNELKTSVLRLLLSSTTYFEIQKGGAGYEATDEEVLDVIAKEAKKRREAIEMYEKGNRVDLAEKEKKELEMLQSYLPQQLSEDEIKKFVQDAISQTNATSMQDMGKVMGALMPKVKGKADGSLVSRIVKEELISS